VKNTSEGIATFAGGFVWKKGDKVVAFKEEFPANFFPWKRLEEKGVRLVWLSIEDPLETVDKACEGARVLAISFVNYLSGQRVDLEALVAVCHRRGCLLFVDAIQGLGAYPVDVRRAGIAALSADGHKWLLGPEGCGVLYVRKDVQDLVEPVEFGWTNVRGYADYASRDMTLRADAGRYECGTLNTIGCFGLRASIEFLLGVGMEDITRAVDELAGRIRRGALAKGYEVMGGADPASGSGIVTFRKDGVDSRAVVHRLREEGIVTAPRQGWVRTSPHFYVAPEGIDKMVDLIP
jgi:selenocysteine lyase/cysteine desulfurase